MSDARDKGRRRDWEAVKRENQRAVEAEEKLRTAEAERDALRGQLTEATRRAFVAKQDEQDARRWRALVRLAAMHGGGFEAAMREAMAEADKRTRTE